MDINEPASLPNKGWAETYLNRHVLIPLFFIGSFFGFLFVEWIEPAIADRIAFWGAPAGYINADPVKTPTKMAAFQFSGSHGIPIYTHRYTYLIKPVADYEVTARVLHTRHYLSTRNAADLIPFDIALGWGIMSDLYAVKEWFLFHHSNVGGRILWVKFRANPEDIPLEYQQEPSTGLHFSNNHIIPASAEVYNRLKEMKAGDFVRLKGYLVDITSRERPGWVWKTSKYDRTDPAKNFYWGDAGEPTCDTLFVTEAQITNPPPAR